MRERIEADGDAKLADLHVWQVGGAAWSAVASPSWPTGRCPPRRIATRLDADRGLRHVTVEVHPCTAGTEVDPAHHR